MGSLGAAWSYVLNNWSSWTAAMSIQIQLSVFALAIGIVICLPLGILAARSRVVSLGAINLFGTLRAIPSIAILFLAYPFLGFGFVPALVALSILACPPILINTAAGFAGVDAATVEAARGMGMNPRQVLMRVEFPLALPVVLAGIRTATLEVIASATLATFIGGGGPGDFIVQGLSNNQIDVLLAGAIPLALMALLAEGLFTGLDRAIRPLVA